RNRRPERAAWPLSTCPGWAPSGAEEHCELMGPDHHHRDPIMREPARWVNHRAGARSLLLPEAIESGDVATAEQRHGHGEALGGPIPPGHFQQHGDMGVLEALADRLGRIAADDGVGLDVFGHQSTRADHRAVADRDARYDDGLAPDPNV